MSPTTARPLTLAIAVFVALLPFPVDASGDQERAFRQLIHDERLQSEVPALQLDPDLTAVARRHSARMAAERLLHHNDDLPREVAWCAALGENVGVGVDPNHLHHGFMDSPSHRRVIRSPVYRRLGVGVVEERGQMWVTEIFAADCTGAPRRVRQHEERLPPLKQVRADRTVGLLLRMIELDSGALPP